jgi:hypothetical protein
MSIYHFSLLLCASYSAASFRLTLGVCSHEHFSFLSVLLCACYSAGSFTRLFLGCLLS